jgi:alkyl sulfatase BDS1-like metallo-beta-lactamase superfamily hydrolase
MPYSSSFISPREPLGGADKILAKGREWDDAGEYRLASEILDKLVHAEPTYQTAAFRRNTRERVMGFEIPTTGRGLVLCSWNAAVGSHAVEKSALCR